MGRLALADRGAGESNLALLIALTAFAADFDRFLKKVPFGDCAGARFSAPPFIIFLFL